jgi:phage shock protein A
MPHDKTRAAARKRMAETGEPYAAARRAVVSEHQGVAQVPFPDTGCVLRMSGEIHGWLAGLRDSNPRAARRVVQTLAVLMEDGTGLGDPLVVSTADAWPDALAEALSRSYPEPPEPPTAARRAAAAAATLVQDIQDQARELESAEAELEDRHRRAVDAGKPQEAAQAASHLAAAQQQAAELQRLLPTVIEARNRLGTINQQLQARLDAFRTRKEVLKASYAAARATCRIHEAIAASGLAGDDADEQQEDTGETINPAQAALADVTTQMERELGQEGWPEGLMELRPGAPVHSDIRILFAVEPPATVLLIAVLEGPEVVESQFPEAVMASAVMLRRVRAGQAPEATTHGYDNSRSFLEELYPGNIGDAGTIRLPADALQGRADRAGALEPGEVPAVLFDLAPGPGDQCGRCGAVRGRDGAVRAKHEDGWHPQRGQGPLQRVLLEALLNRGERLRVALHGYAQRRHGRSLVRRREVPGPHDGEAFQCVLGAALAGHGPLVKFTRPCRPS